MKPCAARAHLPNRGRSDRLLVEVLELLPPLVTQLPLDSILMRDERSGHLGRGVKKLEEATGVASRRPGLMMVIVDGVSLQAGTLA